MSPQPTATPCTDHGLSNIRNICGDGGAREAWIGASGGGLLQALNTTAPQHSGS